MQYNTKWYWEQSPKQNNVIVPTRKTVHPCLDVMRVTEVKKPKHVCNRNQAHNTIQSHTMCLTDSSHDYIFNKIKRRDTIEYERKLALMMVVNDCNSIMI